MKIAPALVIAVALLAAGARADELHLKDGRIVEGRILSRADGNIVLLRPTGKAIFAEADVAEVKLRRSVFDEYDTRAAALGAQATEAQRLDLARWCHAQGLGDALRETLKPVLAASADHGEAHALLDEIKVGQEWLPRERALARLGWRKIAGEWKNPEEVAAIEAARKKERERRALEARINALVARLYEGTEADAVRARTRLVEIARQEDIGGLEPLALRLYDDGREVRAAMLEVRLQHAQLKGFRTRSLSLGTGTPVTVELPETSKVSVGTTVVVPVR